MRTDPSQSVRSLLFWSLRSARRAEPDLAAVGDASDLPGEVCVDADDLFGGAGFQQGAVGAFLRKLGSGVGLYSVYDAEPNFWRIYDKLSDSDVQGGVSLESWRFGLIVTSILNPSVSKDW